MELISITHSLCCVSAAGFVTHTGASNARYSELGVVRMRQKMQLALW